MGKGVTYSANQETSYIMSCVLREVYLFCTRTIGLHGPPHDVFRGDRLRRWWMTPFIFFNFTPCWFWVIFLFLSPDVQVSFYCQTFFLSLIVRSSSDFSFYRHFLRPCPLIAIFETFSISFHNPSQSRLRRSIT